MATLAAYLGPAVDVARLVEAEPASAALVDRYRRPFACAWYPDDGHGHPVRFVSRSAVPVDDPVLDVPRRFTAECIVAGLGPEGPEEGQPLVHGPLTFAWDGTFDNFAEVFEPVLTARLSATARRAVTARSVPALLFMAWLDLLQGETRPEAMADALERLVGSLQDLAVTHQSAASFAIVASNGQCLVTLRSGTDQTLPPLYTIVADDAGQLPETGRVVASEPTFAGSWTSLDPHSLTTFTLDEPAGS